MTGGTCGAQVGMRSDPVKSNETGEEMRGAHCKEELGSPTPVVGTTVSILAKMIKVRFQRSEDRLSLAHTLHRSPTSPVISHYRARSIPSEHVHFRARVLVLLFICQFVVSLQASRGQGSRLPNCVIDQRFQVGLVEKVSTSNDITTLREFFRHLTTNTLFSSRQRSSCHCFETELCHVDGRSDGDNFFTTGMLGLKAAD
ncbi:hypothetical protein CALCODRAFT_382499 [Calocera cornea HHB12733]|uniref:Uncharacterized protein n=1 Tax=Calocera cornea HHB12733 TaxID=1353952 RepID=A0A165EBX0_9BASI|nr:hypothetical protein CALCODRAFT_382499 [Calocera cornea HHB12733]